jgi:hypothetical protein
MINSIIPLLAYTLANRISGGGYGIINIFKSKGGFVPGRPMWYVSILFLLPITALHWGIQYAAICTLSFMTWRTLGWYKALDAGTHEGTPLRDFIVMSLRGLMNFPAFLYCALITHQYLLYGVLLLAQSFAIATIYHLGWHLGKQPPQKDRIPIIEPIVGLCIGLFFLFMRP